jgi:hypothetical protein
MKIATSRSALGSFYFGKLTPNLLGYSLVVVVV